MRQIIHLWAPAVLLYCLSVTCLQAAENVVLITIDGLRWQEVFGGAEADLTQRYVNDHEYIEGQFWIDDKQQRRRLLMPFLWSRVAREGQLYGNREYHCRVEADNTLWFSYPGYNELLVGYADDARVISNDPVDNPNVTVLEKLHRQPEFQGRVAASAYWGVIANIVNEERSGIPVRTSIRSIYRHPGSSLPALFNQLGALGSHWWNSGSLPGGEFANRHTWASIADRFLETVTLNNALAQIDALRPRILYVGFGGPDEAAHAANYEGYLLSIRQVDAYIERLWNTLESLPQYRGKTAYIITPDHGRGRGDQWPHHGSRFEGGEETWFALFGAGVAAVGEVREPCRLRLAQTASTVASLLGESYQNERPVAPALPYR